VFVIAIFDPAIAQRCPSSLLPVSESLPGHLAKSKPKRQSATSKTTKSIGTSSSNNQLTDEQSYAESSFAQFKEGDVAALKASGGVLGGGSETLIVGALTVSDLTKQVTNEIVSKNLLQVVEPVAYHFDSLSSNSMKSSNPDSGVNQVDQARTLDTWRPDPSLNQGGLAIVEPFVKSSRAQTSDDSETWVEGKVNPTLNSFDQGDVRATTAIVEELMLIDGTRVDDVRIYEEPVQTLKERMGTGGNNVPMLAFDTQFGSNANVTENIAPTLKSSQAPPSVAYDPEPTVFQPGTMIRLNGGIWEGTVPTLRAEAKRGDNEPHIQIHNAEPTMAVRRLTPLECERLMGWPDDHTRYKADGTEQADTHRYKQCGNGVASPVAQWIAKHLLKLEEQQ
jgi:hypothetical protein